MVSDAEIIDSVLRHLALIGKGERSVESAGADCFRELMQKAREDLKAQTYSGPVA